MVADPDREWLVVLVIDAAVIQAGGTTCRESLDRSLWAELQEDQWARVEDGLVEVDNGGEEWSIEDRRGPAEMVFLACG